MSLFGARKLVGYGSRQVSCRAFSEAKAVPKLNCAFALDKSSEKLSFGELATAPVSVLQGIGPVHTEQLGSLKIVTMQDLADYKHFRLSRAIQTLAATEEEDGRMDGAEMNIRKGLDRASQSLSFNELLDCPTSVLFGISDVSEKTLKSLGVHSVRDLGNFKYSEWAGAIITASEFEQT